MLSSTQLEALKNRFDKLWIAEPMSGCWLWIGNLTKKKYGRIRLNNEYEFAHRVAKLIYEGYIIETTASDTGLVWDHICEIKTCVNPKHLRLVTIQQNVTRGDGPSARNSRKTHCPKGHEYSPENTYLSKTRWQRTCKICGRQRGRIRFHAQKDKNK